MSDEQVTSVSQPGTVVLPLTDNVGTVRDLAICDPATGTTSVVNHLEYNSFGVLLSQTNPATGNAATVDCLFGFTGRPLDKASGLQNNLNRWYDSSTGRWIIPDPTGFAAGDTNEYRYVGNSPANAVDPTGLADDEVARYCADVAAKDAQDQVLLNYYHSVMKEMLYVGNDISRGAPGWDDLEARYPGIRSAVHFENAVPSNEIPPIVGSGRGANPITKIAGSGRGAHPITTIAISGGAADPTAWSQIGPRYRKQWFPSNSPALRDAMNYSIKTLPSVSLTSFSSINLRAIGIPVIEINEDLFVAPRILAL